MRISVILSCVLTVSSLFAVVTPAAQGQEPVFETIKSEDLNPGNEIVTANSSNPKADVGTSNNSVKKVNTPAEGKTRRLDKYRWVVDRITLRWEMPDATVWQPRFARAKNGDILLFASLLRTTAQGVSWYDGRQVVRRSKDNGETWSEPKSIFEQPFAGPGKPYHISGGGTLKSGRILLIIMFPPGPEFKAKPGKLFEAPTGRVSPYGFPVYSYRGYQWGASDVWSAYSDDDGQTWHLGKQIKPLPLTTWAGSDILQTSEGEVVVPMCGYPSLEAADADQYCFGYVTSKDEGQTWGKPTIIAPWDKNLEDSPQEGGIAILPDGRWVAFYRQGFHQSGESGGSGLYLYRSFSYDQGATWTVGHQLFPYMAAYATPKVLPDGALMVMGHGWNEFAVSNDGGETFDYINRLGVYLAGVGGFTGLCLDDGTMLVGHYSVQRKGRAKQAAFSHPGYRTEVSRLKKVSADSVKGRLR